MGLLKTYRLPVFLIVLAIGIVINFILLIPALHTLSLQANDGKKARHRQFQVAPEGCALALDAYRRGVISRRVLDDYVAGAPVPCPTK